MMPGKRKKPSDLPVRLYFKNGGYHYVYPRNGKKVWELLSRNKSVAIAMADKLNWVTHDARMRSLAAMRYANDMLREEILTRDGHTCVYCGGLEKLGIDHIIPHAKGGATLPFNLVTACADCNHSKGSSDPREFIVLMLGAKEHILSRLVDLKPSR